MTKGKRGTWPNGRLLVLAYQSQCQLSSCLFLPRIQQGNLHVCLLSTQAAVTKSAFTGLAQATVKVAGRELELRLTARQMASINSASLFLPSSVRKSDAGHWTCQAEALASA